MRAARMVMRAGLLLAVGSPAWCGAAAAELPSLQDTVSESVRQIEKQIEQKERPRFKGPGAIAGADGSSGRIYVNLGSKDDVRKGDCLDLVGDAHQFLGRLVVTCVQEALCVCRRESGAILVGDSAVQRSRVVPRRLACRPAEITIEAGVEAGPGALREAVQAALRASDVLVDAETAAGGMAEYEIRGKATDSPGEGGFTLELEIVALRTGARIKAQPVLHRTGVSLGRLGFQAAIAARIADGLDLRRAAEALRAKKRQVVLIEGRETSHLRSVYLPKAGPGDTVAWVQPDGTVIVGSRQELSQKEPWKELCVAWLKVADEIAPKLVALDPPEFRKWDALPLEELYRLVGDRISKDREAELRKSTSFDVRMSVLWVLRDDARKKAENRAASQRPKELEARLKKEMAVHTARADQLQCILVEVSKEFEARLTWPEGAPAWSAIEGKHNLFEPGRWLLDGGDVGPEKASNEFQKSLAGIQAGPHILKGNCPRTGGWVSVAAFFPEPKGRMALVDTAGNPVSACEIFSREISKLYVPYHEGYTGGK